MRARLLKVALERSSFPPIERTRRYLSKIPATRSILRRARASVGFLHSYVHYRRHRQLELPLPRAKTLQSNRPLLLSSPPSPTLPAIPLEAVSPRSPANLSWSALASSHPPTSSSTPLSAHASPPKRSLVSNTDPRVQSRADSPSPASPRSPPSRRANSRSRTFPTFASPSFVPLTSPPAFASSSSPL